MTPSASRITSVGIGVVSVPSALCSPIIKPRLAWAFRASSVGPVRIPSRSAASLRAVTHPPERSPQAILPLGRSLPARAGPPASSGPALPGWALPGALLAFAAGGELVEVGGGQLTEAPAGLDQQPGRDLGRVRGPDPLAEPELRRGVQNTGEVLAERGAAQLAPQAGDLAFPCSDSFLARWRAVMPWQGRQDMSRARDTSSGSQTDSRNPYGAVLTLSGERCI